MIRALRVGTIGARYRGARPGRVFALLPEPAHAFDQLVASVVSVLERRLGEPSVVAPPRRQSLWTRLARFGNRPQDIINPDKLTPSAALTSAATRSGYLEFAAVEFGHSGMLFCTDRDPVLWIWLDEGTAASWSEILEAAAGPWPCSALDREWELPEKPYLSIELPRVMLHWGESASWSDGSRSLGFQAGLGVNPPEVYLPPESTWVMASPAWAAALRAEIIRDFEQLGARVVEMADASVSEGHPQAIIEKPPA
jgi:hypothetical protein